MNVHKKARQNACNCPHDATTALGEKTKQKCLSAKKQQWIKRKECLAGSMMESPPFSCQDVWPGQRSPCALLQVCHFCPCGSTISFHQSYTLHFVTRLAQHLDFQTLACSCSIANIFFRSLRWRPFLEKFMVLKCLAQLCQNLLALYWAFKCGNDYQLVFLASLLKHGEELSC